MASEKILIGIRLIAPVENLLGVVIREGDAVMIDETADKFCRNDAGVAVGPESEVRRILESLPFAFEAIEQAAPAPEPAPVVEPVIPVKAPKAEKIKES